MAIANWVSNTQIVVPINLRYNDDNGDPVTKLYPLEYLTLVGQDLNSLIGQELLLASQVSANTSQISVLTAAIGTIPPVYHTPQVDPKCLGLSGSTSPIDIVLETLVTNWCNYLVVTGSQSALATAITMQCQNLNASPSFATPGTSLSAITGWKTTPITIADSFTNNWLTLCDTRTGVTNALASITPTCSQVTVNYQVAYDGAQFRFFFDGYSFIPTGFTDNGSLINIVDIFGNVLNASVDVVTASTNSSYITVNLSGSTLNPTTTQFTITLTSIIRNISLGLSCQKTTIATLPVILGTTTTATTGATGTIIPSLPCTCLPSTVANNDLNALTSSGTTVVASYGIAGLNTYQITGYINIRAITTNVVYPLITWHDENNVGQSIPLVNVGSTSALISTTGYYTFISVFKANISALRPITVSIQTSVSGGSILYDVGTTIIKIA